MYIYIYTYIQCIFVNIEITKQMMLHGLRIQASLFSKLFSGDCFLLAGGKCLCVSRKMVLCLTYFYVIILVPMSYLKLWYIYLDK